MLFHSNIPCASGQRSLLTFSSLCLVIRTRHKPFLLQTAPRTLSISFQPNSSGGNIGESSVVFTELFLKKLRDAYSLLGEKMTNCIWYTFCYVINYYRYTPLPLASSLSFNSGVNPVLTGRTVSSLNTLRTVRRTVIHFLNELRRTFSSPNMLWTVRRTILRFLTGL